MIAKLIYCQDSASKLTSHIKTNVRSNADNIRKNSFNFSEDQNFLTTTKLYCARVNNASIHIQKFKTRLTNQMPLTAQFFFSSTSYWFCLLILLDKWMTFSRCSLCFSDKCQGFKACFKHWALEFLLGEIVSTNWFFLHSQSCHFQLWLISYRGIWNTIGWYILSNRSAKSLLLLQSAVIEI